MLLIFSCKKSNDNMVNSEVIGFSIEKCYCCSGWNIKYGNDTIKSMSLPNEFNLDEKFPIKVKIELGKMTQKCPRFNYYEIKTIERIK